MPLKVYRYWLQLGQNAIQMPAGAEVLTARERPDGPQLWALGDPLKPLAERRVLVVYTGDDVPDDVEYVATFADPEGLVLHVFDAGELAPF